jgi:ubiquinone/menaquinone biosynthesis C-methylase UbiE
VLKKETMMSHFNEMANSWDTSEKREQNKIYADKIKLMLKQSHFSNVLEFGCGTGLLGANFIEKNNHFLGIDSSVGMLEVFKAKFASFPNVKYHNIDLEKNNLNINQEEFDLIVSSMAFHHLQDPQNMILKFQKMLKPNGAIAIIDLDEENGSFHPDPKKMAVHHFGFSEKVTSDWAQSFKFKNYSREIVNTIKKESGNFPIFLAIYYH